MVAAINLRYVRTIPDSQRQRLRIDTDDLLVQTRRRLILKGMYKYYPTEVVDEAKSHRRSNVSDPALIEDFFKTDQPHVDLLRDAHYQKALKVMTKAFKPEKLYRPVAFPDLRYYPWNLPVSAEAPYTFSDAINAYLRDAELRGIIKSAVPSFHNLFDILFVENRNLVHLIKDRHSMFFEEDGTPRPYFWVNLHARAHVVGPYDEDKIRAVFGVPKLLLFVENMFIWPMQADLLNRDPKDSPMMWGCEIMRGGWKRLRNLILKKTKGKFKTILSADWSQFDRRALFAIIDDTHKIWHSFYRWDGYYQPTSFFPNAHTDPQRLQNLWDWFTHSVKYTPIALPDGRLFQWLENGIASGFQETQLLDSWVNGIMLLTCLSQAGVNIEHKKFFFKLQGDDSIFAFCEDYFRFYGKRFLKILSDIAMTRFNAKLSVDKSDLHDRLDDVYVLGFYNKQGIAYRHDADLLSHLLFPERSQSLEATAGSCLGLALMSMGCSRPFYDTCSDIYHFLKDAFKIEPRLDGTMSNKLKFLFGLYLDQDENIMDKFPEFPSFEQCFYQNFQLTSRTESQKQRTWPTDPFVKNGFYFLDFEL